MMTYPTSVKIFTAKRNNLDKVVAEDVNVAYVQITEIEKQLGAGGVVTSTWGTGSYSTVTSNWYSVGGLKARLTNIEAGIYSVLGTSSNTIDGGTP